MADLIAKLGVAMLQKLLTEQFISRILYHIVRAWANQTTNKIDDKVADAVADAYKIDRKALGE